jgi:hypothetical protein
MIRIATKVKVVEHLHRIIAHLLVPKYIFSPSTIITFAILMIITATDYSKFSLPLASLPHICRGVEFLAIADFFIGHMCLFDKEAC